MQRRVDISYSVWGSLWSMHVQCANLITSFHSNTKDPVIDGCTKIVSCLRGLVYDSRKEEKKSFVAAGRTERAHLGDPGGSSLFMILFAASNLDELVRNWGTAIGNNF